ERGDCAREELLDFRLQGTADPGCMEREILPEAPKQEGFARETPGRSKDLDGIDVERPANAAGAWQRLQRRQPGVEEAMQCCAVIAFQQQLRVMAPGALRHGRG